MGQEIADSRFTREDFRAFQERLEQETRLLESWFRDGVLHSDDQVGGLELEAWLVDRNARPAAINERFLEGMQDPLVVPELARFNVEINVAPQVLQGDALSRFYAELTSTWGRCVAVAEGLNARMAMIGILPTLLDTDLTPRQMSSMQRYKALDEQLRKLRGGLPVQVDISGRDHLQSCHDDVMLESATTSFQIHLKVDPASAGRYFNASKILAAPMVALSANSPYLFGSDLWDETRIPLFEQAVAVGEALRTKRVSFGIRYVRESVMECFRANLERYPVLLPHLMDEPLERLSHLRLHNGTIWRWNRPLIGFSEVGVPHLRIEHRVIPAGPTVVDSIANSAFFFGAIKSLAEMDSPPEGALSFETAQDNFYAAARHGLDGRLQWLDGGQGSAQELCLALLPVAESGLAAMGIDRREIERWLGVIRGRLQNGQNGASWQRAWVAAHGSDMHALTEAYLERQISGRPVHLWGI